MLSASGGLRPPDQGLCPWTPLGALPPDPRYKLVLRTRHGAPKTTDPFRRLWTMQRDRSVYWQLMLLDLQRLSRVRR